MSELPSLPDLNRHLSDLLRQIPHGRVTTYGDLATALGDDAARSARWIGEVVGHCRGGLLAGFDPQSHSPCLCHRVVRQTGEPGLFVLDPEEKTARLKSEGVTFLDERVDLAQCRWHEIQSEQPLTQLRELQSQWSQEVQLIEYKGPVRNIGALDVAYRPDGTAVGAMVIVDGISLEVTWSRVVELPEPFPYIPGYLSFRELPVLLELWQQANKAECLPDVVFIDGNGILHHRRMGIAACFGVLTNTPTLGVGKSLLCGRVNLEEMSEHDRRPIELNGELVGHALKSKSSSRPVFISPGHGLTVEQATQLAKSTMTAHRVPEPIYHADSLTKRAK